MSGLLRFRRPFKTTVVFKRREYFLKTSTENVHNFLAFVNRYSKRFLAFNVLYHFFQNLMFRRYFPPTEKEKWSKRYKQIFYRENRYVEGFVNN